MKSNPDTVNFWHHHVDAYRNSGLGLHKYCLLHQLKVHQLQYWCRKFKLQSSSSSLPTAFSHFLPVQLIDEHKHNPLSSTLPTKGIDLRVGNIHLRVDSGFDHALLTEVLKVVTSLC